MDVSLRVATPVVPVVIEGIERDIAVGVEASGNITFDLNQHVKFVLSDCQIAASLETAIEIGLTPPVDQQGCAKITSAANDLM
jgi:hypothetical protein